MISLNLSLVGTIAVLLTYFLSTAEGRLFNEQFSRKEFWIADTNVPMYDAQRVKRSAHQCEELTVQLTKQNNWTLCIFRESLLSYDFLDERTMFTEDVTKEKNYMTMPIYKTNHTRITGYVIDQKDTSKVDGYLLYDKLLGRIFVNGEVFYIDELITYFPGMMKSSRSVVFNVTNNSYFSNPYEYKRKRRDASSDRDFYEGKEMYLSVYLDAAWFIFQGKFCRKRAVMIAVHIVHVINSVFRSMDFYSSGHGSNMGFYVKDVFLYKNNYKLDLPVFMAYRIDTSAVLTRFVLWESVKKNTKVNLKLLFSGQESPESVNGLAYVAVPNFEGGGICSEPLNGVLMNMLNNDYYYQDNVKQSRFDAAGAHEVGHAFGSNHDPPDEDKEDKRVACKYYLMGPTTNKDADRIKGYQFSVCSLNEILPVLADQKRRECYHDPPDDLKPFCGNRIVEEGEECDCGNKYFCKATKDCCNTYDSVTGPPCTYPVDKSSCTPPAGLCCTGGCQFRNLTYLDLNCGPHCKAGCPCSKQNQIAASSAKNMQTCSCGLDGQCLADECHSIECTRMGLRECKCRRTSKVGCRTCCMLDGNRCVEATNATEELLSRGTIRWDNVRAAEAKSMEIKTATYKKFCAPDKEDLCVWLMFRQFPQGEYCLKQGHVGKCTIDSVCVVEKEMLHQQNRIKQKTSKKF